MRKKVEVTLSQDEIFKYLGLTDVVYRLEDKIDESTDTVANVKHFLRDSDIVPYREVIEGIYEILLDKNIIDKEFKKNFSSINAYQTHIKKPILRCYYIIEKESEI